MEIILTLVYAIIIGFYNVFKKISLKKSSDSVILVLFTTVAFLLSLIWIPFGVSVPINFIPIFALKGFLLSVSWFLILKILKDADLSATTVTQVISSVVTFVLGLIIFKEQTNILQIVGSVIIVVGVALTNLLNKNSKGKLTKTHLILLICSALITTSSNLIDKYTTTYLNAQQVQFWFLFFVCMFSWLFFTIECFKNKRFLIRKQDLKNYWIYLIGLFLFVGDLFLFLAYKVPNSKMITISILSKFKVVVTVCAGIFIFKEKNIIKKIILTFLIMLGTILISIA